MSQLSLFAPDEPRCRRCCAARPDGYERELFLEPVSQECHACNHATLVDIARTGSTGEKLAYAAAWKRHLGKP